MLPDRPRALRRTLAAGLRRTPAAALRLAGLAALAALVGLGSACGEGRRGRPWNVLLVTIDTLRADALGAYGQSAPTSPTIDALAREGVLFEQCIASAPNTVPSHATLFTGQQPFSHGVRANVGYVLAPRHRTLAEALREAGYRTGAEIASVVMGRRTLLDQGFDEYRDLDSWDVQRMRVSVGSDDVVLPERTAPDVTRRGVEFIERHAGEPYFLWLHYFDPHSFYAPPPPYRERFPESPYHGEVRYVDDQLAIVLDALRRTGVRERTLVVVTSDHGESLGEHGELTHSFFVYDATLRVPLVLWAPGLLPEPRRVASLVRSADVAPTILDLLGLPGLPEASGVSLLPLLRGERDDLDLVAYGESAEVAALFSTAVFRALRQGSWKYIHKVSPELYDVARDPDELHDRIAERPEVAARLRARLEALLRAAEPTGEARAGVDRDTRAQLATLGYVAGGRPAGLSEALDELELSGPDPRAVAEDLLLYQRGWTLLQGNQNPPALEIFQTLRERHPDSAPMLFGLLEALKRLGRASEAIPALRDALARGPVAVELRVALAQLEAASGRADRAEALLAEALEQEPCSVEARIERSALLQREGRHAERVAALEQGVARCPDSTDLRNDLAYALATSPDPALRDGRRAFALAEAAVRESRGGRPAYLDTLAAALAELGRFEEAVRIETRALALLERRGANPGAMQVFRRHLAQLQAGSPIRD